MRCSAARWCSPAPTCSRSRNACGSGRWPSSHDPDRARQFSPRPPVRRRWHFDCTRRRVRRTRGLWWSWLAVVVVAGLAGAADEVGPAHEDADGGRGRPASSLGIDPRRIPNDAVVALERGGARFVWPDLDAACYADPAAAVERLALKG